MHKVLRYFYLKFKFKQRKINGKHILNFDNINNFFFKYRTVNTQSGHKNIDHIYPPSDFTVHE